MRTIKTTPPVPPSFFLSLSPEQQKQLSQILASYKLFYSNYYGFSGKTMKQDAFIFILWENRLNNEVLRPLLVTKNMFRMLQIVYFLKKSPKFKGEYITKAIIKQQILNMGKICRLQTDRQLRQLTQTGYLRVDKLRWNKNQYLMTEKGHNLIIRYSARFTDLFNDFFQPLNL